MNDEGVRGHFHTMSGYQTLYRKYRSQTFADLVGQEAASRALQGALKGGRVAHAYLFSGSRGTGKTTTARLLAKALNCSQRAEGSAEPCNRCESCLQIMAGTALDLIEIDAASNRGIDEIRDLRDRVNLAPALGKRKVYIIDEAHGLTGDAFNALLKTLEEPPDHVVFVLCTTEAQKIPLTVLGRCQQFVFRRHSEEQVVARLEHIAKLEGIGAEPEALHLIAHTAQGSMRDAVGLLDQLVPLATGPVTAAGARELLGIADPSVLSRLFELVLAGQPTEALQQLGRIYEGGGELRQVVRGLMERCRDLLVQAIDRREEATAARLSGALDALLHLDGEVRRHAEPRFLVEATLVRLAVEGRPATAAAGQVAQVAQPAAQPASVPAPEGPSLHPAPAGGPTGAGSPTGEGRGLAEGWKRVLEQLRPGQRAFYREGRPELEGSTLILWFPYAFHHQKARENAAELMPLVATWLGEAVTVDFRLQEASASSPAPSEGPEDHPLVQAAIRKFEGRVTRVRELKP